MVVAAAAVFATVTPPLCLSSGSQQPAGVACFLETSSGKKGPLEYGEMEISNDQHVVRVRVTTPPLQSKNRNSHIPQPFMHVHFYVLVLSGKHEVTLPRALMFFFCALLVGALRFRTRNSN